MGKGRILVTGAAGFIGGALLNRLRQRKWDALGAARTGLSGSLCLPMPDLSGASSWYSLLKNRKIVVHAAARAHVLNETEDDPLSIFRRINTIGTLHLAGQAAESGVKRFIFISSVAVSGQETRTDTPFNEEAVPRPSDPYGISKYEAEQGLMQIAARTGMEVVIIRPPLVYGPGVKANFLNMIRWLHRGLPLPLAAIDNRRSLVALDNLLDLIVTCIDHPAAANQVFLVSDGEDLSTPELLRRMARALGGTARLFPVPVSVLRMGAKLLGKEGLARQLCGSLQVDIGKAERLLGWTPPVGVDEALRQTARHFLKSHAR